MSDAINTVNATARIMHGYNYDIEQLQIERSTTTDPETLRTIDRTIDLKKWHLQRHRADLAAQRN